jgi:hypothetical protein
MFSLPNPLSNLVGFVQLVQAGAFLRQNHFRKLQDNIYFNVQYQFLLALSASVHLQELGRV